MESLERRLARTEKLIKTGDKKYSIEALALRRIYAALEAGRFAGTVELAEEERALLRDLFLLTDKPIIYVANIAEDDVQTPPEQLPYVSALMQYAAGQNSETLVVSAKVEEELSALEPEERDLFMGELGIQESGLSKLIRKSYALLGLISFLTAGKPEVRAWTIRRGTKAPQAAGKIHTDFERGFIRAEVIAFDTLQELGGDMALAKEKGLIRQEGKEYVFQDGDIALFRFNV